jgi:hypothetical protein
LLFAQVSLNRNLPILRVPQLLGWQVCTTMSSFFLLRWPGVSILPISAYLIGRLGMTSTHCCIQLLVEMGGVSWTFCPGRSSNIILPISASQVVRIAGMSHQHPTCVLFLNRWVEKDWALILEDIAKILRLRNYHLVNFEVTVDTWAGQLLQRFI